MSPEQLERLRSQLPPFGEAAPSSALLEEFCRFYNIDFAARYPQLNHSAGTVRSGAYSLAVHYWHQPNASANLLLLHGYFDHTGLFGKLIDWGLSSNCNVLIFDLPGHGLSSGEPAVIDDFSDYSRAIKDVLDTVRLPQLPQWVMAQSTGCAALIDFAGKYAWPFSATVLLAPLIRPASWFSVRLAHKVLRPFVDSVRRKFVVNSSDCEFLDFLERDSLQCRTISLRWIGALSRWLRDLQQHDLDVGPALIVQSDTDDTVDWRYNVGFLASLFPESEVAYLSGAGHQLANESAEYREDYLQRVEEYVGKQGVILSDCSGIEAR